MTYEQALHDRGEKHPSFASNSFDTHQDRGQQQTCLTSNDTAQLERIKQHEQLGNWSDLPMTYNKMDWTRRPRQWQPCKNTMLEWKYVVVKTTSRLTTTSNILNNADTVKGEILRLLFWLACNGQKQGSSLNTKKIRVNLRVQHPSYRHGRMGAAALAVGSQAARTP